MRAYWKFTWVVLGTILTPAALAGEPDYPLFGDVNDDCVVDINDMNHINKLIGTRIKFDKGDLNDNGRIDVEDYFLVNVSVGSTCGKRLVGDVDGSGIVTARDLNQILADFGTKNSASDINGDWTVDSADIDLVQANWGRTLGRRLLGDVNGDNVVDARDLSEVLAEWGKGASAADMDGDNVVGDLELGIVKARFGMTAGRQVFGDVDGNLLVNHIDALLVRGAQGTYLSQFDIDDDGKVTQNDYDLVVMSEGNIASDSLPGDVNGDWVVDDRDMDSVQAVWGTEYEQADIDGNGTVGARDLNVTLASYGNTFGIQRTGDIDGNGVPNETDLNILRAAWGSSFEPADLNSDGIVNGKDLSIFLSAPRPHCGTPDRGGKPTKGTKPTSKKPSKAGKISTKK